MDCVGEMQEVWNRRGHRREESTPGGMWKQSGSLGQALGKDLALPIRIAAALEHDLDGGEALARGRANRLHILRAGEQSFQRPRDQRLDLSRVEAGRLGLHQHMGGAKSGNTSNRASSSAAKPSAAI